MHACAACLCTHSCVSALEMLMQRRHQKMLERRLQQPLLGRDFVMFKIGRAVASRRALCTLSAVSAHVADPQNAQAMRHYARRPAYKPPRRPAAKKRAKPLVQPDWDVRGMLGAAPGLAA